MMTSACNLKGVIATALLLSIAACVTERGNVTSLSVSMIALNQGQPFVSQSFAERLALLVIEEKYPRDFFTVRGSGNTVDKGDIWLVTFDNGLTDPSDKNALAVVQGRVIPKRLTITIRKANCEIVAIS